MSTPVKIRPHMTITKDDGMRLSLECVCPFCHKIQNLEVDRAAFVRWTERELIQNAFPTLSPDQREALMTGICEECFP